MKAVIQAGGKGTRLRPYTLALPKPLMPVGDHPVIEILVKWLRRNGFEHVYMTIGYLGNLIRTLCGDGSQWGLKITYSEEQEPLGTIGPLSLLAKQLDETFVVLNGDLITDLNLREFIAFHKREKGLVSVAVFEKDFNVELGVIENINGRITGFREKPTMRFVVSMGVYCMEPDVLDLIPKGVPFGFDDLMHTMLALDLPVRAFRHNGCWMDIGLEEDFRRAQRDFKVNSSRILGY